MRTATSEARLSARESFYRMYRETPATFTEHLEDGSDVRIYPTRGRALLLAFAGTSGKPACYTLYRTEEAAREAATQFLAGRAGHGERRREAAAERANVKTTLEPGRVLVSSWGYDQTNVDYYQVVAVSPSRKSVTIRKIAARSVEERFMAGSCWPLADEFIGPEMVKRVGVNDEVKVRDWGAWARPWVPKADRWTSYA